MHAGAVKVHLEYTAVLNVTGPASGSSLELPAKITVGQLMDILHIQKSHQSHVVAFVNAARVRPSHVLADGDHVHLAVPMSGG